VCRGHHGENKRVKVNRTESGACRKTSCLLLEEAAELVHHATAAAVVAGRGTTVGTAGVTTGAGIALVLLESVLSDAADDGSTDCSEDAVVGLVASETTCGTASEGTSETTLAILCLAGSLLLIISRAVVVLVVTLLLAAVLVLLLLAVALLLTMLGLLGSRVVVVGRTLTLLLVLLVLAIVVLAVAALLTIALLGVTLTLLAVATLVVALVVVVIAVARHVDVCEDGKVWKGLEKRMEDSSDERWRKEEGADDVRAG
jgi:hypothetical protein